MIALCRLSRRSFARLVRQPKEVKTQPPPESKVENRDKIKVMLENKFEAKELDQLIDSKIGEGKNDKQIVQELLGMPQKLTGHE